VDDKGEWAEWTFALHALPLTDNSISRVAVGGG
jgi:hypothetical protein